MKRLCLCLVALISINCNSQKKYLVTFDKLNDSFKFEELVYSRGNELKKEIKKPLIAYGDILIIKAVNLNEFVFDIQVDERQISKDIESNPVSKILAGFNPMISILGGNLGTVINEFGSIISSPPADIISTRDDSNLSQNELFNNQINRKALHACEIAKQGMTDLKLLKQNINLIYSENKTLDEIKLSFGRFAESFDMNSLLSKVDELNVLLQNINSDMEETEFSLEADLLENIYSLRKSIETINNQFNNENNPISKDLIGTLQNKLETVDFEVELFFIPGPLSDIQELEYSLKFININSIEENSEEIENENIKMIRMVNLKTEKRNLPQWSTGLSFVSPFGGTPNYEIKYNETYDSLSVTNLPIRTPIISIATNLMYEFNVNTIVLPHVLMGMGLGVIDENERKISFLIGGGIRFSTFPYLSLNGGVSITQNQVIRKVYQEDVWIPSSDESILFENRYKPGYFFGINVHF